MVAGVLLPGCFGDVFFLPLKRKTEKDPWGKTMGGRGTHAEKGIIVVSLLDSIQGVELKFLFLMHCHCKISLLSLRRYLLVLNEGVDRDY